MLHRTAYSSGLHTVYIFLLRQSSATILCESKCVCVYMFFLFEAKIFPNQNKQHRNSIEIILLKLMRTVETQASRQQNQKLTCVCVENLSDKFSREAAS